MYVSCLFCLQCSCRTGREQSALEFCFELLAYTIPKMRSGRDCPQTRVGSCTPSPPSLLSVIFGSHMMTETFLGEVNRIKGDGSVFQASEIKQGGEIETGMLNTEYIFSQSIGDLIVLALERCEQFRTTTEFSHFVGKVFAVCESCVGNPSASNHMSKYPHSKVC